MVYLSPYINAGVAGMLRSTPSFHMAAGFWLPVLMLVQQALLIAEPFLQHECLLLFAPLNILRIISYIDKYISKSMNLSLTALNQDF